jgi:hypothetical protein
MAESKNGTGNLLVKSISSAGLLALLGAAAFGGFEWRQVKSLETEVASHCERQLVELKEQALRDRSQDAATGMQAEVLARIEGNTSGMQKQLDELTKDIKVLMLRP